MPNLTPQDFVAKWKLAAARERQSVQEHFIDLCVLLEHETPMQYDPTGMRFAFEMGATRTSGGQGWADVAKLGYFGWEYKAKDADLDKAYEQLLRYRDSLQNPPLLVVSDINHIVIRTNFTNLPTRTITLTLDDLLKPESILILKKVFTDPEQLKPQETVESVTREAAEKFARLADNLRRYGNQPQEIAHFLIRLLFCLFAEDIGLLPKKLFPQLLEQTRHNSKDFTEVLKQLFRAMNTGGYFGAHRILYFNGGLFDSDTVLPLDRADMDIIADIDSLDWAAIEPSIFGTLFERGLDPTKRSELGAHYTDKDDIVLIVEPVLMQPLLREWEEVKKSAIKIAEKRNALSTTGVNEATKQKIIREREKLTGQIQRALRGFADKIASTRVLDPACGSGNFLYVSLRLLLDLQNKVIALSEELGAGRFYPTVSPQQLYGIEINEYAHELAQITVWIGYIQWLVNNGYGFPSEPILKPMQNIQRLDAILAYDADGKPIEPQWVGADVIVGNPPFLGDKKMRAELGDKYVDTLRKLYKDKIPGQSDLVCYWFEKARAMIEQGKVKRAGLLATNSIRNGANNAVLLRIKETGDIFWAQSDHKWTLDGAAVNVSMIGFDDGSNKEKFLDNVKVTTINSDLSAQANIVQANKLIENFGICFLGMMKAGPFDIDGNLASIMFSKANPNEKPNSDIVKPRMAGQDVTDRARDIWVIDFEDMSMEEAAQYEEPFEYVKEHVKPLRDTNRRERMKQKWWLFGENRPGLRKAISKLKRCIVTPEVSKYRLFIWMNTAIIPDHKLHVIARDDDYFLGVLHSKLHQIWSLKMGSTLEDRPSYSSSRVFETFPFPFPPGKEKKTDPRVQAIAAAAKELVQQRDRWLNAEGLTEAEKKKRTLTNLYNQRPTWLHLAHQRLDQTVFTAYGWDPNLTDEQILEKLLALNLERSQSTR